MSSVNTGARQRSCQHIGKTGSPTPVLLSLLSGRPACNERGACTSESPDARNCARPVFCEGKGVSVAAPPYPSRTRFSAVVVERARTSKRSAG